MPCSERVAAVAALLEPQVRLFESSVARTAEETRGLLVRHTTAGADHSKRTATQLGDFGQQYIDMTQFTTTFRTERAGNERSQRRIERAIATFDELAKAECDFFVTQVPRGGSLYETVKTALGRTGRAFGAARVAHSVASGRHVGETSGTFASFPFDKWNASERRTAPPLIVEVEGNDLRPAALGEFMDGTLKIVLVVEGPCSPAPLARLISPGTFVLQCESIELLTGMAAYPGPGIAAVVPSDCALFVHDPTAGTTARDRLAMKRMPKSKPRKTIAGLSNGQQAEELQILSAIIESRTEPRVAQSEEEKKEDPVDKLAAWLLAQADVSDIREGVT